MTTELDTESDTNCSHCNHADRTSGFAEPKADTNCANVFELRRNPGITGEGNIEESNNTDKKMRTRSTAKEVTARVTVIDNESESARDEKEREQ